MRCIEILQHTWLKMLLIWLTLTWDVLKSYNYCIVTLGSKGLTLTWDVLKYKHKEF